MAAYMVIRARITERKKFAAYARRAAELVARFGGVYRVLGGEAHNLEGAAGCEGKWVISEWPDAAAARAFWDSPDYREAARLREGCGEFEVMLVEGPAAPPAGPATYEASGQ